LPTTASPVPFDLSKKIFFVTDLRRWIKLSRWPLSLFYQVIIFSGPNHFFGI